MHPGYCIPGTGTSYPRTLYLHLRDTVSRDTRTYGSLPELLLLSRNWRELLLMSCYCLSCYCWVVIGRHPYLHIHGTVIPSPCYLGLPCPRIPLYPYFTFSSFWMQRPPPNSYTPEDICKRQVLGKYRRYFYSLYYESQMDPILNWTRTRTTNEFSKLELDKLRETPGTMQLD